MVQPTPQPNKRAVRDLVAQMVEDHGADAVVVLWTVAGKEKTSIKMATWGNQVACAACCREAVRAYARNTTQDGDE